MDGLVGHTNRRGAGRPRFGQGQARSAVLKARVKPHAREAFRAEARRRGLTESDALRQAAADWMAKGRPPAVAGRGAPGGRPTGK